MPPMDIRKVKKLIELLEESGIAEIEIKEGEESVRISRQGATAMPTFAAPMYAPPLGMPGAPPVAPPAAAIATPPVKVSERIEASSILRIMDRRPPVRAHSFGRIAPTLSNTTKWQFRGAA